MEHSNGTEPHAADESQTRSQQRNAAVFTAGSADMAPITGPGDFYREFVLESKKLWFLAGPAIFSFVSKYSLGAFTQIFAGHIGTIDLTAVSVENSLIAGFSYGILVKSCRYIYIKLLHVLVIIITNKNLRQMDNKAFQKLHIQTDFSLCL